MYSYHGWNLNLRIKFLSYNKLYCVAIWCETFMRIEILKTIFPHQELKKWKQFCILFKVLTNWDEYPFCWKMHGVHYLISFFLQRIAFWMFSTNMIMSSIQNSFIWKCECNMEIAYCKAECEWHVYTATFYIIISWSSLYVLCRIINITTSAA